MKIGDVLQEIDEQSYRMHDHELMAFRVIKSKYEHGIDLEDGDTSIIEDISNRLGL